MAGAISIFSFLSYFLLFLIPLAPIGYLMIKWRMYREHYPDDPQLAARVILYYFKTLSYHTVLVGLALILFGILKEGYGDETKTGLGIFISGLIIYVGHEIIIGKLGRVPDSNLVVRFYTGFNLIIIGLATMASLAVTLVMLFKGDTADLKLPVSILLIYGFSWIFRGFYLMRNR